MARDRGDEWIERLASWVAQHKARAAFAAFLAVSFWLIYGLGQIAGSQSLKEEAGPLAGKRTLAEVRRLVEAGQLRGKLIINDGAKLRDQYGNLWLVEDFSRAVSKREMDFLRANQVSIEGDARVELVNRTAAGSQIAFANLLDFLGKALIAVFYGLMGFFIWQQLKTSAGGFFSKAFRNPKAEAAELPTFADVAGHEGPKREILEVVDYLRDPARFDRVGARPPRGVLLYGPPGNGKTLIAKAVAGEAKAAFREQNASAFMQMFVGMGAARVRDLFREARKNAPCVIFIDEIDSIGASRMGSGSGGGHDERIQTINALLAELDGFADNRGIVVVAATNRLEQLDEALVRPGRFDRKVYVPLPGRLDRAAILAVHARRVPRLSADLGRWADRAQGFSGADLANLVNEAAVEAAREGREEVTDVDFSRARDRILMGPRNHGHSLTDSERRVIAYHEAGHAALRALGGEGLLEKVSILPRGLALGVTVSAQEEERLLITRKQVENEILILMGGRAAEEIFCGQVTSGASNDMERASHLARSAITRYGFDGFGPYIPEHSELAKEIELKAAKWVKDAYERALETLAQHRGGVEAVVAELLANDEIEGERVLAALGLPPRLSAPGRP